MQARKKDFAKWNRLLAKTLIENLEADFRNLSWFETKYFEPKTWADFEANIILKIAAAKKCLTLLNRTFAKNQKLDL